MNSRGKVYHFKIVTCDLFFFSFSRSPKLYNGSRIISFTFIRGLKAADGSWKYHLNFLAVFFRLLRVHMLNLYTIYINLAFRNRQHLHDHTNQSRFTRARFPYNPKGLAFSKVILILLHASSSPPVGSGNRLHTFLILQRS